MRDILEQHPNLQTREEKLKEIYQKFKEERLKQLEKEEEGTPFYIV